MQDLETLLTTDLDLEKIFKFRIIVDWYDGPTLSAYRVTEIDNWLLANLCFFNPNTNMRILTFIEVDCKDNNIIEQLPHLEYPVAVQALRSLYETFDGEGILYLYDSLGLKHPKMSQIDGNQIQFFDSVEDALAPNNQFIRVLQQRFPELTLE